MTSFLLKGSAFVLNHESVDCPRANVVFYSKVYAHITSQKQLMLFFENSVLSFLGQPKLLLYLQRSQNRYDGINYFPRI